MPNPTEIIAHRGNGFGARENTMAAILKVLEWGQTGLEIDVHLTRDGAVVVHHDHILAPDVTRHISDHSPCKEARPIEQLTIADIQRYEIAETCDETGKPLSWGAIPLLSEVLDEWQTAKPDNRLLIELKSSPDVPQWRTDPRPLAQAVTQMIVEKGLTKNTAILSFDWMAFEVCQSLCPELSRHHLSFPVPKPDLPWPPHIIERLINAHNNQALYCGRYSPTLLGTSMPEAVIRAKGNGWGPYHADLTQELVDEMHKLGGKVGAWTAKTDDDITNLLNLGIDTIITDDPKLAVKIMSKT